MGMTRDTNDILNRPLVAVNAPKWFLHSQISTATLTTSATSTVTAISIQGPGYITHFTMFPQAAQRGTVKMLIDGETAYSVSASMITAGAGNAASGVHLVGTWEQDATGLTNLRQQFPVTFESNFSVLYQFPNHSSNFSVVIYYTYGLTV